MAIRMIFCDGAEPSCSNAQTSLNYRKRVVGDMKDGFNLLPVSGVYSKAVCRSCARSLRPSGRCRAGQHPPQARGNALKLAPDQVPDLSSVRGRELIAADAALNPCRSPAE